MTCLCVPGYASNLGSFILSPRDPSTRIIPAQGPEACKYIGLSSRIPKAIPDLGCPLIKPFQNSLVVWFSTN